MKLNISTANCPVCAKQGMTTLADTVNEQIICTVCEEEELHKQQEAGLKT